MRLSTFIAQNKESILQEWENFARTILPPALTMDIADLRAHASDMLDTITADLDTSQTSAEQSEKSTGQGPRENTESNAEKHGDERLRSGFTINQLVSEYRALRASVLKLWARDSTAVLVTDPNDVTRFNEAIDQALAESVARFAHVSDQVENERRFLDAVLEAAPVGIVMVDANGKLIKANAETKRILGEHPWSENVDAYVAWKGWWADGSEKHGRQLSPHEWAVVRALGGEEVIRDIVEIESFGSPVRRRIILIHASPIRDAANNVTGAVVAQTDITAQVKTEAALRESEAKFRIIANAMPQMVWSALPNGYCDYYNQQWYDFTGVPEGATDGHAGMELCHPEDQPRMMEIWHRSLATGETYEIQYRLRHRSGQYRWALGRALPVRDESGDIFRWMGTCTDIHDQKLAEHKLKEADRRKDEFLAMLAHELRNPLAPISAAAELLKMVNPEDERVRQTSEIIARQVSHMTSLVDDLLDVSRVTRGLIKLDKSPLDIRRIVADAVEQMNPLIHAQRHHLTLHMPPETPTVMGDHKRLVQVIGNLLANAAKYTNEGGNILLKTQVLDEQIVLTVEDDGIGMAPELAARVFDLFAQSERSSDRSSGGLGLGLSLVKSLVELHGGNVACASEGPGKGSQFTVCLPRLVDMDRNVERRRSDRSLRTSMKSLKIMVVDDNVDAARMLCMFLEASGHTTIVEHGSRRALERARIELPNACLLDIGLPEMDGNELARRLRAQPETAKTLLIAVTGYGQDQDRKNSLAAGFDHHMVKPVDTAQLATLLADAGNA